MKKYFFSSYLIRNICIIVILSSVLNAKNRDYFRLYGDIFSFLPAMAGIYSLTQQDYEGLGYLAIGTGSTLAITFATKYAFVGISKNNPQLARISLRPDKTSYDGFPSGHTSSAFSAAGFMQKRYGYKWGIPTTILATLVGASRITSKRHTYTQVIVGAALGYTLSYFITSEMDDLNVIVDVNKELASNNSYQNYYKISFSYKF